MKKLFSVLLPVIILSSPVSANGVCIVNSQNDVYLNLQSSKVQVQVEIQIAIVTATPTFLNMSGSPKYVKYGFPMREQASATVCAGK